MKSIFSDTFIQMFNTISANSIALKARLSEFRLVTRSVIPLSEKSVLFCEAMPAKIITLTNGMSLIEF